LKSRCIINLETYPSPNSPTVTGDETTFNVDGDKRIVEVDENEHVQLGSVPDRYRELTAGLFSSLFTKMPPEPWRQLAVALSIFQSYGINDVLIENGVGGAFCGAFVTATSIHWQGDMLYCLCPIGDDPFDGHRFIASIIRENVLIVASQFTGETRVFVNQFSCRDIEKWKHRYGKPDLCQNEGKIDYLSFLVCGSPSAVTVEILGRCDVPDLKIGPLIISENGLGNRELKISRRLMDAIKRTPEASRDGQFRGLYGFFALKN